MLKINRSTLRDGYTFSLDPRSEISLRKSNPKANPLPRIFIAVDTAGDLQQQRGDVYEQIALLLTTLSEKELKRLGGFEILDSVTDKKIFASRND